MRVILAECDGLHVEIKCPGGYSPDVLVDMVTRARELMAGAILDRTVVEDS